MKAIHRLYQYFESKGIKPTRLEKEIGVSNGYFGIQLKREADLGSGILESVVNYCRDLDLYWLITGTGSMIRVDGQTSETQCHPPSCDSCKEKERIISSMRETINTQENCIDTLKRTLEILDIGPSEGQKRKASALASGK